VNKHERSREDLLHELGGVLIRDKKHRVFRLEDGQKFVVSKTPSTQGSSKASLATLKRIQRNDEGPADILREIAPEAQNAPRKRFSLPNNPPRPHDDYRIILPASLETAPAMKRPHTSGGFESVADVLMAADRSEEFWNLDASGRIRVLDHLMKSFAKVEVLPSLFTRASIEEVPGYENVSNQSITAENLQQQARLPLRTLAEWGGSIDKDFRGIKGVPSLLVSDPLFGKCLIEASAWSTLEETNYLFFRTGDLHGTAYGISSQVWDATDPTRSNNISEMPDHFIYTYFITRGMAKRKNFGLLTSASWTDKTKTRAAIQQIREIAGK